MKRLVILRALGMGDLLTAVPALRALADSFPDHRRVLAAPAELAPLALLSGAVHEVSDTPGLVELDREIAGPDVAVNLHGRGPQSHRMLLALAPRLLIAFANPAISESAGMPRWKDGEPEVQRWCRLLDESGIPADPSRIELRAPRGPLPALASGATLLHPGARSARRRPADRWAAVARAEVAAGRQVIVTAGRAESALAYGIARQAGLGPETVFAGWDLSMFCRLLGAAGRVVCAEAAVARLATALGVPSVVLLGPPASSELATQRERREAADELLLADTRVAFNA